MARTTISTTEMVDLSDANQAPYGLMLDAGNSVLGNVDSKYKLFNLSGTNNGKSFSFANTEFFVIKNDTSGAITFTIVLAEPDEYAKLGITFNDKSFSVPAGEKFIFPADSRYKDSSGNINIDASATGGHLLVVKRYSIV